ncbi:branched-chain amino acid ABC transporter permease [Ferrovibrio terrae]|uniref:branched-chain amino acid ABC transporter permease n=1 Tax=Ferrovibrio terrae TaxID=2594003 RepID=UPI0031382196
MTRTLQTTLLYAAALAVLLLVGLMLPQWLLFLLTMAASHGVVGLGLIVMMRGGVVSFGQGLVFAIGGYVAGLAATRYGITDAVVLVLLGCFASALAGAIAGPLLARYRSIFFAMLTLALSMVLYGILVKSSGVGGSDGFNVPRPSMLGLTINETNADYAFFALSSVIATLLTLLVTIYCRSSRGLLSMAIRDNELRVEYLGTSVRSAMAVNFVIAAALGGAGGALTVISLGHIDPNFSYWTTSGEFVFMAILAGHASAPAVFLASLLLELVRSFSNKYFPDTWQLALGLFLLLIILFLPKGVGSLWAKPERLPRRAAEKAQAAAARQRDATEAAE